MAELQSVLKLKFRCTDDSSVYLSIADPKLDLSESAVKSAMNIMIAENIFDFGGTELFAPVSATIVKTETTDVFA